MVGDSVDGLYINDATDENVHMEIDLVDPPHEPPLVTVSISQFNGVDNDELLTITLDMLTVREVAEYLLAWANRNQPQV